MRKIIDIRIPPSRIKDSIFIEKRIAQKGKLRRGTFNYQLVKRSIDARGKQPVYQLRYLVGNDLDPLGPGQVETWYSRSPDAKKALIIGAGPCGYFAALRCIEHGICPIIVERGKDVRSRRRDLRQIQQFHTVNPDSNYCFGEGGAGTYSDGKLYTRSVKRGNVKKVLQILHYHGANRNILIDAHPHIGSNKLPNIIKAIRETILSNGGEVHFNARVVDFVVRDQQIRGVITLDGRALSADAVILCTGHGARDIYQLCHSLDIQMEFKPFALGMRLEHPQQLIDEIQYNRTKRGNYLPAASYSLSCQLEDSGVFSFCMCPGGLIVPAATAPGELVVNGMSLSKRDSPFANAAVVNTIDTNPEEGNPFGGVNYQSELEHKIFNYGDGTQRAPAQRLTDFMESKISVDLPKSSYIPGIYPGPLHELMPGEIVQNVRSAILHFDKKMKGYYTSEAQFVGLESRTSAPIRIPRDNENLMSPDLIGLFPAGEGAGYAGGILSAALDGERVADALNKYVHSIQTSTS